MLDQKTYETIAQQSAPVLRAVLLARASSTPTYFIRQDLELYNNPWVWRLYGLLWNCFPAPTRDELGDAEKMTAYFERGLRWGQDVIVRYLTDLAERPGISGPLAPWLV